MSSLGFLTDAATLIVTTTTGATATATATGYWLLATATATVTATATATATAYLVSNTIKDMKNRTPPGGSFPYSSNRLTSHAYIQLLNKSNEAVRGILLSINNELKTRRSTHNP